MDDIDIDHSLYFCPKCFGLCLEYDAVEPMSNCYRVDEYPNSVYCVDDPEPAEIPEEMLYEVDFCSACCTKVTQEVRIVIKRSVLKTLPYDKKVLSLMNDTHLFTHKLTQEELEQLQVLSYKANV